MGEGEGVMIAETTKFSPASSIFWRGPSLLTLPQSPTNPPRFLDVITECNVKKEGAHGKSHLELNVSRCGHDPAVRV